MISFIIPNRGGTQIEYIVSQMKRFYPNDEYIVVSQDDNEPFMRGQLFNIGYYYAKGNYLCFMDNDIFFSRYVDLIGIYEHNHYGILQPFNIIGQVKIKEDGTYEVTGEREMNYQVGGAFGGVSFVSTENFRKLNGFSNLYLGWGREDNELYYRGIEKGLKFENIKNTIYHITHPRRINQFYNNFLLSSEYIKDTELGEKCIRDHYRDSYRDTSYEITYDYFRDGIRYVGVKNIEVHSSFGYKDLLDAQHETADNTIKDAK